MRLRHIIALSLAAGLNALPALASVNSHPNYSRSYQWQEGTCTYLNRARTVAEVSSSLSASMNQDTAIFQLILMQKTGPQVRQFNFAPEGVPVADLGTLYETDWPDVTLYVSHNRKGFVLLSASGTLTCIYE